MRLYSVTVNVTRLAKAQTCLVSIAVGVHGRLTGYEVSGLAVESLPSAVSRADYTANNTVLPAVTSSPLRYTAAMLLNFLFVVNEDDMVRAGPQQKPV